MFINYFVANCSQNVPVKKIENPLTFGEDMDNKNGTFSGGHSPDQGCK